MDHRGSGVSTERGVNRIQPLSRKYWRIDGQSGDVASHTATRCTANHKYSTQPFLNALMRSTIISSFFPGALPIISSTFSCGMSRSVHLQCTAQSLSRPVFEWPCGYHGRGMWSAERVFGKFSLPVIATRNRADPARMSSLLVKTTVGRRFSFTPWGSAIHTRTIAPNSNFNTHSCSSTRASGH